MAEVSIEALEALKGEIAVDIKALKLEITNLKFYLTGQIYQIHNLLQASANYQQFRNLLYEYTDFLTSLNDPRTRDPYTNAYEGMSNILMRHSYDIDIEKYSNAKYDKFKSEFDVKIEDLEEQNKERINKYEELLRKHDADMEERRQAREARKVAREGIPQPNKKNMINPTGDSKASVKDVYYDNLMAELETFGGKHKSRRNQKSKKNRKSRSRKNY